MNKQFETGMRSEHSSNVLTVFTLWILFCGHTLRSTDALKQKSNVKTVSKYLLENYTGIKDKIKINKREICESCVNYRQYHVILGPHPDESRSEYLDLLIVVPSSYNHDAAERRSVIRRTWANASLYPQFRTRHVFVMGEWIMWFLILATHHTLLGLIRRQNDMTSLLLNPISAKFVHRPTDWVLLVPKILLPPATKLRKGYVFTSVCDSVHRRGACVAGRGVRAADGTHPTGMHPCLSRTFHWYSCLELLVGLSAGFIRITFERDTC